MKVLVISHNIFSKTSSMGKTLTKYFEQMDGVEVAQLFIHSEVPVDGSICRNYYRITDMEALKSIFSRKSPGTIFTEKDICDARIDSRTDVGVLGDIYQKGRARTPIIYLIRDSMWSLSKWWGRNLRCWIDTFNPDIVYFASGDYCFTYKIALKIAKYKNIPLVVNCVDDFYFYNQNEKKFLGNFRYKHFMSVVKNTMDYADAIVTICQEMADDYSKLFKKKCCVIYTPAENRHIEFGDSRSKVAYFGSLGLGRAQQLIDIGRCLKYRTTEPMLLDVYSSEPRKEVIDKMCAENGIAFHGAVSQYEMLKIYEQCLAVVHTESFNEETRKRIRYSISTKIPEALSFGPCLIAYGPTDIASISYLKNHTAACVIDDKNKLQSELDRLLSNEEYRGGLIKNARALAEQNHLLKDNCARLKTCFEKVIAKTW